ncbi:hypothetical protein [Novosphingobium sp. P6W]|uniref:DUF6894 family protein n=1 Tax=Novosphingobium sp. P6W TaxID=1609758 RepID=UPI0005C4E030|nr:hypothetical protein [Novosphingobium sp. P6W]AXB78486.1 hypothetical protein TQ38_017710 [Novosphingobium sp. P6W]
MPNYYFHVTDGQKYPDLQGMSLVDLHAAKKEAVQFTGDMLIQAPDDFCSGKEWSVKVVDEEKNLVFEVVVNAQSYATDTPVAH